MWFAHHPVPFSWGAPWINRVVCLWIVCAQQEYLGNEGVPWPRTGRRYHGVWVLLELGFNRCRPPLAVDILGVWMQRSTICQVLPKHFRTSHGKVLEHHVCHFYWVDQRAIGDQIWAFAGLEAPGMASCADGAIVQAWLDDPLLYNRGTTTSKIANIINRKISRPDVTENKSLLLPVITHLGMKPDVNTLSETCRAFLLRTRPRGKGDLRGTWPEKQGLSTYVLFLQKCSDSHCTLNLRDERRCKHYIKLFGTLHALHYVTLHFLACARLCRTQAMSTEKKDGRSVVWWRNSHELRAGHIGHVRPPCVSSLQQQAFKIPMPMTVSRLWNLILFSNLDLATCPQFNFKTFGNQGWNYPFSIPDHSVLCTKVQKNPWPTLKMQKMTAKVMCLTTPPPVLQ